MSTPDLPTLLLLHKHGSICGCPSLWTNNQGSCSLIHPATAPESMPAINTNTSRKPAQLQPPRPRSPQIPPRTPPGPVRETCFFWYHGRCQLDAETCPFAHESHVTWPIPVPKGFVHFEACWMALCPLREGMEGLRRGGGRGAGLSAQDEGVGERGLAVCGAGIRGGEEMEMEMGDESVEKIRMMEVEDREPETACEENEEEEEGVDTSIEDEIKKLGIGTRAPDIPASGACSTSGDAEREDPSIESEIAAMRIETSNPAEKTEKEANENSGDFRTPVSAATGEDWDRDAISIVSPSATSSNSPHSPAPGHNPPSPSPDPASDPNEEPFTAMSHVRTRQHPRHMPVPTVATPIRLPARPPTAPKEIRMHAHKPHRKGGRILCFYQYHDGRCTKHMRRECPFWHRDNGTVREVSMPVGLRGHKKNCEMVLCPVRIRREMQRQRQRQDRGVTLKDRSTVEERGSTSTIHNSKRHSRRRREASKKVLRMRQGVEGGGQMNGTVRSQVPVVGGEQDQSASWPFAGFPDAVVAVDGQKGSESQVRFVDNELPKDEARADWDTDELRRAFGEID